MRTRGTWKRDGTTSFERRFRCSRRSRYGSHLSSLEVPRTIVFVLGIATLGTLRAGLERPSIVTLRCGIGFPCIGSTYFQVRQTTEKRNGRNLLRLSWLFEGERSAASTSKYSLDVHERRPGRTRVTRTDNGNLYNDTREVSLTNAGILPRIGNNVVIIYVERTASICRLCSIYFFMADALSIPLEM